MAADPSQNVHAELLPHVHLLSTFRYATSPTINLHEVTKWLMSAPKIARDTAPFFWTYLDCPQDGCIFLTWQPTARRNTEFASDGYIWPSGELYFRHEAGNGLILEIYHQRCGYRIGDQFATHSRRRFRLLPGPGVAQMPNIPQVDPNLWIVHYGPSEKNDRLPVNMIPPPPPMQHIMNVRQQLFSMGQIVRKEFMLSDRVNWPQMPLPMRGQAMYAPPMPTRNMPQGIAYPPHPAPQVGPTPKRRGGPGPGAAHPPQMMGAPFPGMDSIFDDDEDISRGDMFDHLTPHEISLHRYQQNHEWMEEILSSPYRIGQIEVADLGFGLKGELASLTDGIFEAQGSGNWQQNPKKPMAGHLDPELAAQFKQRIADHVAANEAEIARLKEKYANVHKTFKDTTGTKQAERELRLAVDQTGTEFWRLEGRLEDSEEDSSHPTQHIDKSVDEILAQVEKAVGKHAAVVSEVMRIQDGGYQEPAPEPEPVPQASRAPAESASAGQAISMSRIGSQNSGVMIGDSDTDMGGTAAGLLDQMHGGFSSTSTPLNNFPTPQPHLSAIPSSAATPANLNVPSPLPAQQAPPQQMGSAGEDMRMDDVDGSRLGTAPDQGTGSGDWVVVPKGGVSPGSSGNPAGTAPAATSSKPASAAPTPGEGLGFDGDNNDFSSLGDLDTAGDALAGYDPPSVDAAGLGDLNMDMEDSAFGDAFHGVGQSGGNTPADGM
ncbi:SWI/SNF and RSC complexes subunit ssr4 [Echria macrotheca]|uniref:SWI/SNF and RSC complexes subunit ssr4 n=1 Tax=Echria macrotheca TaxID=438768 RepID=A0AAJ0BFS7_9PEZI|nr:SWI/SNF and RSC complexes subunit ssr4 [Echria macrotheca]